MVGDISVRIGCYNGPIKTKGWYSYEYFRNG